MGKYTILYRVFSGNMHKLPRAYTTVRHKNGGFYDGRYPFMRILTGFEHRPT